MHTVLLILPFQLGDRFIVFKELSVDPAAQFELKKK